MENLVVVLVIGAGLMVGLLGLLILSVYLYSIYQEQKQTHAQNENRLQQYIHELKTTSDNSVREKNELKTRLEADIRILGEKLERVSQENAELHINFARAKASLEQETQEKKELLARYESDSKALAEKLEMGRTYSVINGSELEKIVRSIPSAQDVCLDADGDVSFMFRDQDQDLMSVIIRGAGSPQLVAAMPFAMPDDYLLASVIASNNWNQRVDTQSSFAYTVKYDDKNIILLETDLSLRGGASRESIKAWLELFISKINLFEESVLSDLKSGSIIKDSQIRMNGSSNFWGGLASFAGKVLGEALKTMTLPTIYSLADSDSD